MFKISPDANINYLAKIVKIENIRKHSNADKLYCTTIDGNNLITGVDTKVGDVVVYFPLECSINLEYLSWSNSFKEKTMNKDPEATPGFFEKYGRVKALRLRGEKSEGYIVPLRDIEKWLNEKSNLLPGQGFFFCDNVIGQEFDFYNDIQICKKYIPKGNSGGLGGSKKDKKLIKRISRLVEGQFRLHEDTAHLKKNIHKIEPYDYISITEKLHGTSFVVGKILTKRKLKIPEKFLKNFGIKILETEYDYIYASRNVVKNQYETRNAGHFYGYDLWAEIKDQLKNSIVSGITLYGECVGFTKTGAYIQNDYDYGLEPGNFKLYIYRITQTNADGHVVEFTWPQIKEYCRKFNLNHVPEKYYGLAKDLFPDLDTTEHWHENFLNNLQDLFLEKNCVLCKNKVPAEGIVLRQDKTFDCEPFKLKSFRFLEKESKDLDKGIVDMETAESSFEEKF